MTPLNWIVGGANLFTGVLVLALSVPLLRRKVGRNRLYGARFEKSLESDEAWYRINEYGARRLIAGSLVVIATGIAALVAPLENPAWLLIALAAAPAAYLLACLATYRYAQRGQGP